MADYRFQTGGIVTQRHHMTLYIYPSLLDTKANYLRFLPPVNHESRRRPQGEADMDTTHITISPTRRELPTAAEYAAKALRTGTDPEPLDIAMCRATRYTGNTVLEAGIFAIGTAGVLWIVVRRKTLVRLRDKSSKEHSATYKIRLADWNKLKPSNPEHDHWWRRLDDLFMGRTDRACLYVKQITETLQNVRLPWVKWARRPDVERLKPSSPRTLPKGETQCMICGDEYDEKDRPVILSCDEGRGHHMCIACTETALDQPETRLRGYFRCPFCRKEQQVPMKRLTFALPQEQAYWRYRKLEEELADFIESFELISQGTHLSAHKKTQVNAQRVIKFMNEVLIYIEMLMPYGYQLDNPVTFLESRTLHQALRTELQRCNGQVASVTQMRATLEAAARNTVKCIRAPDGALGNPQMPPNFVRYRDRLVRRVAHSSFLSFERIAGVYVWMEADRRQNPWPANLAAHWMS